MKEKGNLKEVIKMTREEAIDTLKNGFWWDRKRLDKAIDTAVSALRPVSRKQVKKVWGRTGWVPPMDMLTENWSTIFGHAATAAM